MWGGDREARAMNLERGVAEGKKWKSHRGASLRARLVKLKMTAGRPNSHHTMSIRVGKRGGYMYLELYWHSLSTLGLPRQHSGKESTCQCRRHKKHSFDPWLRKILWRRKRQTTPVFLPGESHGQRSLVGLQFMGLQRVGHDWATLLSFTFSVETEPCALQLLSLNAPWGAEWGTLCFRESGGTGL